MRLYSFANFYLSPLQHGLQTAHCVSEMSQCREGSTLRHVFNDWAASHKTIIILNGGNSKMILDTYSLLKDPARELGLPLVNFYEDEQSLCGALTSCAIILPEYMYTAQSLDESARCPRWFIEPREGSVPNYNEASRWWCSDAENTIISHVRSHRLI